MDYNSAFNTVIPSKLIQKLLDLGLGATLCNWTLDFLNNSPKHVQIGRNTLSTLILNTSIPQGSVLISLLYSLFTYDCVARYSTSTSTKFADDTTIVGLITNNNELAYREEVKLLAEWCLPTCILMLVELKSWSLTSGNRMKFIALSTSVGML